MIQISDTKSSESEYHNRQITVSVNINPPHLLVQLTWIIVESVSSTLQRKSVTLESQWCGIFQFYRYEESVLIPTSAFCRFARKWQSPFVAYILPYTTVYIVYEKTPKINTILVMNLTSTSEQTKKNESLKKMNLIFFFNEPVQMTGNFTSEPFFFLCTIATFWLWLVKIAVMQFAKIQQWRWKSAIHAIISAYVNTLQIGQIPDFRWNGSTQLIVLKI